MADNFFLMNSVKPINSALKHVKIFPLLRFILSGVIYAFRIQANAKERIYRFRCVVVYFARAQQ